MDMEKIAKLKEYIDESKKIVFFGGAGVSTESGIPDFRSEKGLYKARSEYGYSPEEIISRSFFDIHPDTFFDYYKKNLVYLDAEPNKAHKALAKLEEQGKLLGGVTQNIDGLHQKAGSKKVYELHGSVLRNYCMRCHESYTAEEIVAMDGVPKCECGGTIKPDVVLYEEMLDDQVISGAIHAIEKADMMIVGGTSLVVYPAAGMIRYFRGKHLVVINMSATQADRQADLVINDSIGEVLGAAMGI